MQKITFGAGEFYTRVVRSVQDYFQKNNISIKGNRYLYSKTIILVVSWIALYMSMILRIRSPLLVILAYIALGIVVVLIGFNVMHDGGHNSYSTRPRINTIMGYTMNFLWSNIKIRKAKHNLLHHTYTNIDGYDEDIDALPFLRFHPTQRKLKYQRLQFLYRPLLYMMSGLIRFFFDDFVNYVRGKYGQISLHFSRSDHIIFWISKLSIVVIYIIIPLRLFGPWTTIIGVVAMYATLSLIMNIVFQLAHMVEKAQTPHVSSTNAIDNERAVHEVVTTANFAMKNKLVTRLVWGLNFQIEHHLFPHISHIHYPNISKIVQDACKECGIQYNAYATFFGAFYSHIKHLKNMWHTQ